MQKRERHPLGTRPAIIFLFCYFGLSNCVQIADVQHVQVVQDVDRVHVRLQLVQVL